MPIVWLYRAEEKKFCLLVDQDQRQVEHWLSKVPERIAADNGCVSNISTLLETFADNATLTELNADQPKESHITQAALDVFKAELAAAALNPPIEVVAQTAQPEAANPSAEPVKAPALDWPTLLAADADAGIELAKTDRIGHGGQFALQATGVTGDARGIRTSQRHLLQGRQLDQCQSYQWAQQEVHQQQGAYPHQEHLDLSATQELRCLFCFSRRDVLAECLPASSAKIAQIVVF